MIILDNEAMVFRLTGGGSSGASISISSFTSNMNPVLKGYTGNINFSWTINGTPIAITLTPFGAVAPTATSQTVPAPTSDTAYTLQVTDGILTAQKTLNILMGNDIVWGTFNGTITTISDIQDIHTKVAASNMAGHYIWTNTAPPKNLVFAYPDSYPEPVFYDGIFEANIWNKTTVSYTNSAGFTETYAVLTSINQYNSPTMVFDIV